MWGGAFQPFNMRKHRDYCGDITNHIIIESYDPLGEDWWDDEINPGFRIYEVTVSFVGGDTPYFYEVEAPPRATEDDILLAVLEYISPDQVGG